jgi:hypothetical protein
MRVVSRPPLISALLSAFFLIAQSAQAQEIRKMAFMLGTRQDELKVDVSYHDPAEVDARLKGSRLLPVQLTVTNVSSQPVSLNYADFRLNLNGNQLLSPVDAPAVAEEIRRMHNKFPKLMNFLGNQDASFHRTNLDKKRLEDGRIQPGKDKDGFIYFMRPGAADPAPFNGIMWLETSHYGSQALETKSVTVKTAPKPGMLDSFRQWWQTAVSGEFPYKKSYALLIGIGNYKYLDHLSSPDLDVKKMQHFLFDTQGFDEVMAITDENVTAAMFQYPQDYFSTKVQPGDRFLFYYSGHGVSLDEGGKPRGYLPLVNERPKSHANSIAMDNLVTWMKGLKVKHLLVILDACFSGLAVSGVESHGVDDSKTVLLKFYADPARFLMMAGTENQESIADKKWNGSLFTDKFIEGAQKAQIVGQSDKVVATHELWAWLRPQVISEAISMNRRLTPLLKDLAATASEGEFIFFRQ